MIRWILSGLMMVAGGALVSADVLVLTSGQRIQGELVGVSGRDVEFEERDGRRRRLLRIPRRDIDRIEFDVRERGDDREPVASIPRGMRERRVNITGREAWTDTGIEVRAGQQVYFASEGETRWGPSRRDGAEGERNSPANAGRPLPDRPAAALIGRVGEREEVFFIGGESGPFRLRGSGRLFLGINDDFLSDNAGNLRVTVYY